MDATSIKGLHSVLKPESEKCKLVLCWFVRFSPSCKTQGVTLSPVPLSRIYAYVDLLHK